MIDPESAAAMTHLLAERLTEAAAIYRSILDRTPDDAESLHFLGLIATLQGDPKAGIALIRRAMSLNPGCGLHHHSLGQAYRRLGRLEEAERAFRDALALLPDLPEIHNNLATILHDVGRHQDAIAHYRRALKHAPGTAAIWYNLANVLSKISPSPETEIYYRKAIELQPDYAKAFSNYGRWLVEQGRWQEAEMALAEAIRLVPTRAEDWNILGLVQQKFGRPAAEACYRNAISLDPQMARAHCNLGHVLFEQGRTEDAIIWHEAAIAIDPAFFPARVTACMARIPILYRTEEEIAERRYRYTKALESLVTANLRCLADGIGIGSAQPFYLPYQGQDDRALQAMYGQFACRVLADLEPLLTLASPPRPGERIRIGIVSGFFCDHTLFKLFLEGWLTQLDRDRFEVIGFHTGYVHDARTALCAGWCDRFVQKLATTAMWRGTIAAASPHILLYPEVGIDPIAGRMAAMRLAPVQCVAWGHPETTGMPTIDHFLSSELMEPDDGDTHYTEQLVRLPNLGLCYVPEKSDTATPLCRPQIRGGSDQPRTDHGRSVTEAIPAAKTAEAPVFWSGQALYKYLPQYDAIFPRIAAELGACHFIFIGFAKSPAVTEIFRERLSRAFAAVGLDASRHVVILPPLSQRDYLEAVSKADVILDTPGWSGGKSTLDCLAHDPAIVTIPGRFMRGRHTAAILRRIGCEATIAGSLDDYVSIAVRLARDPVWRSEVRQAVARGKHRAFRDRAYVRALETFLVDAVLKSAWPEHLRETNNGIDYRT